MALILCVEDEEDIREEIVEELRDAGYEVMEASNGQEGLGAIVRRAPDLVIADITMPVLDGYGLLSTLRERHSNLADMPFIFLSALADNGDQLKGYELGADDYLTKPVDFDLMLARVKSRLRQVERMTALKDKQMLRLHAFLKQGADPNASPEAARALDLDYKISIVTVTNDEIPINNALSSIKASGHEVINLESGRAFIDLLEEKIPDLVLISFNTKDLQAPLVFKTISPELKQCFLSLLIIPPSIKTAPQDEWKKIFNDTITWPFDDVDIVKKVESMLEVLDPKTEDSLAAFG